jgi:hypothetical protein
MLSVQLMPADDLTPAIMEFLAHVHSVDELETLMLLVDAGDRWFDPATVSRQLGVSSARTRAALDALAANNLLDIRLTDDIRYRFRPGRTELEDGALAVAAIYQRQRSALVRIVSRRSPREIRDLETTSGSRKRDG